MQSFTVSCAKVHRILCKKIAVGNSSLKRDIYLSIFATKSHAHERFVSREFRTIFRVAPKNICGPWHGGPHTPFAQAGAETSDTGEKAVKLDPCFSWKDHSKKVSADVGDESTESRSVVQALLIPSVIHPERFTSAVAIRWTDELLCGGYKWVSRFETPCIPTRWAGKQWVEQMSRIHGRCVRNHGAPLRQCSADWMPARIGRLSAVTWWRHSVTIRKASLMAGTMRRVWPLRRQRRAQYSTFEWIRANVAVSQRCCSSNPFRGSKQPQECESWCQLFAKWLKVSAIRERPVNVTPRYLRSGQTGMVSLLWLTFSLAFGFLVEVQDCRHRFCRSELQLPSLELFTYSWHVFALHPFQCLPVSISMYDC